MSRRASARRMSAAAPVFEERPAPPEPSFRERFLGMITRPRETFARMSDPDAWFWPAVLMLIGYTLYYLAIGIGMAQYQSDMMSRMFMNPLPGSRPVPTAAVNWMLRLIPASQVFSAMLQVPLAIAGSWALRTALFYGLARLLGGGKPFWGRVVSMVGWAWVPLFIQYVLLGILMMASPQVFSFFIPMPDSSDLGEALRLAQSKWHVQVIITLSPFVLWNLYLCAIGLEQLFELPRWKAALVVIIPTIAQILLTLGSFFLYTWMLSGLATAPGATPGQ